MPTWAVFIIAFVTILVFEGFFMWRLAKVFRQELKARAKLEKHVTHLEGLMSRTLDYAVSAERGLHNRLRRVESDIVFDDRVDQREEEQELLRREFNEAVQDRKRQVAQDPQVFSRMARLLLEEET